MTFLIRPLLKRLQLIHEQRGRLGHNMLAAILLLVLASSFTTQWIGLHAFFGAFVLGVLMPKNPKFIRHLSEKFQDFTLVFLLPLFFAYIGLNTNFALLDSAQIWAFALLLLAIACIGKIGGVFLAGRLFNLPWRDSAATSVLLNTRGLILLIILSVGLDVGVIHPQLFAVMVLVILGTTAVTTPLLNRIYPARLRTIEPAAKTAEFSILIPISLPKSGGPLVQIADAVIGPARHMGKLLALHLRRSGDHEPFHSTDDQTESEAALIPLLSQARARSLPVEPITFVSNDIPSDIAQTASGRNVNLVLMGYHNPIFGKAMLGGTVHRVLTTCPAHVAVFVDRDLRNIDRILVPYLGSAHDALALELAARIVRNTTAQVKILHVVPPMTPSAARSAEAKRAVEKIFDTRADSAAVNFQVVEDSSPAGVVLHRARDFDLVIIGVAEEWGLESRLFGWRPEKIARDCPASLLIVRKFAKAEESTAKSDLQQPAPSPAPRVAI
jgi:nucleotide-binding universal stress UspA family protein